MKINDIQTHCSLFLVKLANILVKDDYVLTDIQFYKGDEGLAHVEIRAKRISSIEEDEPLWWVCAIPLTLDERIMQPSLENFNVGV